MPKYHSYSKSPLFLVDQAQLVSLSLPMSRKIAKDQRTSLEIGLMKIDEVNKSH